MSKSTRELLVEFAQKVGQDRRCYLQLKNGGGWCGDIEVVQEECLQFNCFAEWQDQADIFYGDWKGSIRIPLHTIDLSRLFYWNERTCLWMRTCWHLERQIWIDTESQIGDIPPPVCLDSPADGSRKLKLVGWWLSEEVPYCPHPKYLVAPEWRRADRKRIVDYLNGGYRGGGWLGFSYCRFGCFRDENLQRYAEMLGYAEAAELVYGSSLWTSREMGSANRTDGVWIWPEGLGHYVQNHEVRLPDEFVLTMEQNAWSPMPPAAFDDGIGTDMSFWLSWASEYIKHEHGRNPIDT